MNCSFLKPNSIANFQTIPDESVTGIAVKEDRHQNIMSSVVFEEGNRRTFGQVREWQGSSTRWYTESTLKSDTKAGNNRGQKSCSRGHAEGCSQRRQAFKRVGRKRSDVDARSHQNHQVPCGELHARRTLERLPDLAVVGGTRRKHVVQVPEGSRRSDATRKIAWQEACTRVCVIRRGENVLAKPTSSEPLNRMNPRYKFGVWLGVRNNSAECFAATAEGVFRAREVSRIEHQDR